MIKNVSVIGAGTMGNGIAHVFAQHGFDVTLIDVSASQLEKAIATISKNLDRQVAKGQITEAQKRKTLENIILETDLSKGVASAHLVVEAATENEALKVKIFNNQLSITQNSSFTIYHSPFTIQNSPFKTHLPIHPPSTTSISPST